MLRIECLDVIDRIDMAGGSDMTTALRLASADVDPPVGSGPSWRWQWSITWVR